MFHSVRGAWVCPDPSRSRNLEFGYSCSYHFVLGLRSAQLEQQPELGILDEINPAGNFWRNCFGPRLQSPVPSQCPTHPLSSALSCLISSFSSSTYQNWIHSVTISLSTPPPLLPIGLEEKKEKSNTIAAHADWLPFWLMKRNRTIVIHSLAHCCLIMGPMLWVEMGVGFNALKITILMQLYQNNFQKP